MITPTQLRMAMAALRLTPESLAAKVNLHVMTVVLAMRSDVADEETSAKLEHFFAEQGVFFLPKEGVCIGADPLEQERRFSAACYQLLIENGIKPSSADLIAARKRADEQS